LRDILEHVLDGELESLFGFPILGLLTDEVVLSRNLVEKSDHRVGYRQAHGSSHEGLPSRRSRRVAEDQY
jgi:hypothetical protein